MNRPRLDFEDPRISDDEVKMWTGWRRGEILKMHESTTGLVKQSKNRSSEFALIIFWIKVRTSLTCDQIGVLMNYKYIIRRSRKADLGSLLFGARGSSS